MRTRSHLYVCVLAIASTIALSSCSGKYPGVPAIGSSAPEFALPNQHGQLVNLRDYRGQWVVLYFYPVDFTREVTDDMLSFKAKAEELKQLNAVLLGVSGSDIASHNTFAKQQQLPFTLLADDGRKVAKQYGTFSKKMMHKMAVFRTFIIDPTGNVARVLNEVGPTDPGGGIISTLNTLQQSSPSGTKAQATGITAPDRQGRI